MTRWAFYAPYQGLVHLMLLRRGWKEHHCIYVNDEVLVKLTVEEDDVDRLRYLRPQSVVQ